MQVENEILVNMALATARTKAGTWLALSEALGVGRTTVYSWKYGKFLPSCEQFLNILNYIGVTENVIEGIEKAEGAESIVRALCQSRETKNRVRKRLCTEDSAVVPRSMQQEGSSGNRQSSRTRLLRRRNSLRFQRQRAEQIEDNSQPVSS